MCTFTTIPGFHSPRMLRASVRYVVTVISGGEKLRMASEEPVHVVYALALATEESTKEVEACLGKQTICRQQRDERASPCNLSSRPGACWFC